MVIPEDVATWLEVYLWSPAEHRIPVGAKARFIVERIKEFKQRLEAHV